VIHIRVFVAFAVADVITVATESVADRRGRASRR
jgi:hypothetical protein